MNCRRIKIFHFAVILLSLLFVWDLGAAYFPQTFAIMAPVWKNHINSVIPDLYKVSSTQWKGWLGEKMTSLTYGKTLKDKGWNFIDAPRPLDKIGKSQGLDHLALKFDEEGAPTFRVVETKYTKGDPSKYIKKELTRDWVEKGIEDDYIKEAQDYGQFNSAGQVKHTSSPPSKDAKNILPIDEDATYYTTKNGEYRFYDPKNKYATSEKMNSRLDYLADKENWTMEDPRLVHQRGSSYDVDEYDFNAKKINTELENAPVPKEALKSLSSDIKKMDAWESQSVRVGKDNQAMSQTIKNKNSQSSAFDSDEFKQARNRGLEQSKESLDIDGTTPKTRITSSNLKILAKIGGSVAIGAGIGAVFNILGQGIFNGWANIDYRPVLMSAAVGGLTLGIKSLGTYLMEKSAGQIMKKIANFFPTGIDMALDIGYSIYQVCKGNFSIKQAAVEGGFNLALDAVPLIIGTSIGGPAGFFIGLGLAAFTTLGNYFIVNPINRSIEVHDIFKTLASPSRSTEVAKWTAQALKGF